MGNKNKFKFGLVNLIMGTEVTKPKKSQKFKWNQSQRNNGVR